MSNVINTFSTPTAQKLVEIARREFTAEESSAFFGNQNTTPRLVKAPTGGIPARAGNTPGSATCEVVVYDADSDSLITITNATYTVYNWAVVDVCTSGERLGWASRDGFGTLFITSEDCNDE